MAIDNEELRVLKLVPRDLSGIINIEDIQVILSDIGLFQEQMLNALNSTDNVTSSTVPTEYLVFDDFVSGLNWSSGSSGGSSSISVSESDESYGVWLLDDLGSDAYIVSDGTIRLGDDVLELSYRVKLVRGSSNPIAFIGLFTTVTTGNPIGVCLKIDYAATSNWIVFANDGVATSSVTSNTPVVYDEWVDIAITVSRSSCVCKVNDRVVGSVDSNIPTTSTDLLFGVKQQSTVSGFKFYLDRVSMRRR